VCDIISLQFYSTYSEISIPISVIAAASLRDISRARALMGCRVFFRCETGGTRQRVRIVATYAAARISRLAVDPSSNRTPEITRESVY